MPSRKPSRADATAAPAPSDGAADQLELIGPRGGLLPRRPAPRRARRAAGSDPVAAVVLDSPVLRLDRVFDFLVPADLAAAVRFGVKVRVPFAGRRIEGWVVGRAPSGRHPGELQWIDAVVAPEPQLTPQTLELCRAVADHYLGSLSDVLRLAVPTRHAAAAAAPATVPIPIAAVPLPQALDPGPGRWAWTAPPGSDWAVVFAASLARAAAAGGRALAVVPDGRDVARLTQALGALVAPGSFAALTGQGPAAARYSGFRAAMDGSVPIVIGTRSAAFVPLQSPDLLLLWDDGDDSHEERRAPYPHAREVLGLRSTERSAYIVAGYARTPNVQRWLEIGWAREVPGPPLRRTAPMVQSTDDDTRATPGQRAARLPPRAGEAIRSALLAGPVLVSVARAGYLPRLACAHCRAPADCPSCTGPLALTSGHAVASCTRCGRLAGDFTCPSCGGGRLRSLAVGSGRTAEELGRAFPGVPVVVSSGDRVVDRVGAASALVVATPGAEPVPDAGYAAVVLLDMAAALALPGLRSAEQAMRRWFNCGALAVPGAPLIAVAAADAPAVQALIRWDPGWFAARELRQREQAELPPARKAVSLTGPAEDLAEIRQAVGPAVRVLGPVAEGDRQRILLTVAHRSSGDLVPVLRALLISRSARRAAPVTVRVDPSDLI